MLRLGDVIVLLAASFGVLTCFVMLGLSGFGTTPHPHSAHTIFMHEVCGLVFSLGTVVLGAVCISTSSWLPMVLLLGVSLSGALIADSLVSASMAVAFCGGLIAIAESAAMRRWGN